MATTPDNTPQPVAMVRGTHSHTGHSVESPVEWLFNPIPEGGFLYEAPATALKHAGFKITREEYHGGWYILTPDGTGTLIRDSDTDHGCHQLRTLLKALGPTDEGSQLPAYY